METFSFTGVIVKEGADYSALCTELDVASQGRTAKEAKEKLLEAVSLYAESAIESNLPLIRPVPPQDDPRQAAPETIAEVFNFKVDVAVRAHA
jgi:predicted RNase H-like HicB family nuclease